MERLTNIDALVAERPDKLIRRGDLTRALRNTNPMHMSATWVLVYFGRVKAEMSHSQMPWDEHSVAYYFRHQLFNCN